MVPSPRRLRHVLPALALLAATAVPALGASGPGHPSLRWRTPVVRVHAEPGVRPALLRPALAAWNASGARIRLRPTARRRNADILVRRPGTGRSPFGMRACTGWGTISGSGRGVATRGTVVWRSCTEDGAAIALLTHELGHAIGLGHHPAGVCGVMDAVAYDSPRTGLMGMDCAVPPRGSVYCGGPLTAADIRAVVARYGGTPGRPTLRLCAAPDATVPPGIGGVSRFSFLADEPRGEVRLLGDPDLAASIEAWQRPGADCAGPGGTALTVAGAFDGVAAQTAEIRLAEGTWCIGAAYRGWSGGLGPVRTAVVTVTCSDPLRTPPRTCTTSDTVITP